MSKPIPLLDATWFLTESAASPKHVGCVLLFEVPQGRAGIVGEIVAAYRAHAPTPPFNYVPRLAGAGRPVFVEATGIDPMYHMQHLVLPAGATYKSFLALVADLHEPVLDRNRPLFRMWAIEGLPGDRFALYLKVHHGIIDGASGTHRIFGSLLSTADRRIMPPVFALQMPARKLRLSKGLLEKLGSLRTATAKQGIAVMDVYLGAIRQGLSALLGSDKGGSVPFEARRSPLNEPLSVARSFATMSLPFAELRAIGKAFGATMNDVAATIVDEGLHRYLRERGHSFPDRLVAMCPVSLREEGDTEPSTKASAMFVRMGAPDTPVAERIGEVIASIAAGKAELRGMSKDAAMFYAIAALGLAELIDATRLKNVVRPVANFVLSNVPGAKETRYLAGARLVGSFPISALGMGVGLNVTLTSYADTVDFGFVGNGKTLKDLDALACHTRSAYDELKAAAPVSKGTKPVRKLHAAPAPNAEPDKKARAKVSPAPSDKARKRPRATAAALASRRQSRASGRH